MENRKKLNSKKSAMTLAEILIVVVIIAIIACVLIAMPRKNVPALDRTKYYIAYSTLQRLLSEQLAESGKITLKQNSTAQNCKANLDENFCKELKDKYDTEAGHSFGTMVNKWLNVAGTWNSTTRQIEPFNENSNTNAILSNGIMIDWSGIETMSPNNIDTNITTAKFVWVDIDGPNEGRDLDQKDKHYFQIYRYYNKPSNVTYGTFEDIRIRPVDENRSNLANNNVPDSNSTWITFKVFKIDDNGNTKIVLLDQNYKDAYDCYEKKNGNKCANKCTPDTCFIEPIPPLK